MGIILLVVLLILVLGGLPEVNGRQWGYAPSGLLGTLLIVMLILVALGHVPAW